MNITNFRDLGGYQTQDGRRVKHGCFYRSAAIVFPSDTDRREFEELGMKAILDLRSPMEVSQQPDDTVPGCAYIHCSAADTGNAQGGNVDIAQLIRQSFPQQLAGYLMETYRTLPFRNPAYQIMFDLIKKHQVPFVFHCTAGKDRTGVAAYLILKTLGVDDETIIHDYMLSNEYRKDENEKMIAMAGGSPALRELLVVKEAFLQLSIHSIQKKYGDFGDYLNAEYNLTEADIHSLRDAYLE